MSGKLPKLELLLGKEQFVTVPPITRIYRSPLVCLAVRDKGYTVECWVINNQRLCTNILAFDYKLRVKGDNHG